MNRSEQIGELAAALAKAQGQMTGAKKDSDNPFFKSKYADLASVVDAIREPFAENGLAYVQAPCPTEGDRVEVETVLMHSSGQWVSSTVEVPVTKQDAQGYGSALTYARRYGLQAIAGVAAEDDDGNAAAKATPRPPGADMMPQQKASRGPELFTRSHPKKEAQAEVRAPEPGPKAADTPLDKASGPGTVQDQEPDQAAPAASAPPVQEDNAPPPAPIPTAGSAGTITWELAGANHTTKGLTREQFLETVKLCPALNKRDGKGTAQRLLLKLCGVESRNDMTEAQGAAYIAALYEKLPEMKA